MLLNLASDHSFKTSNCQKKNLQTVKFEVVKKKKNLSNDTIRLHLCYNINNPWAQEWNVDEVWTRENKLPGQRARMLTDSKVHYIISHLVTSAQVFVLGQVWIKEKGLVLVWHQWHSVVSWVNINYSQFQDVCAAKTRIWMMSLNRENTTS